MARIAIDPILRFNQKYIVNSDTGCWEWTGCSNNKGYGYFYILSKNIYAHRFSYEYFIGPIPEDLCVLHKCDNPSCVRPDHLFLGTNQDNVNDKVSKNRHHRGEQSGTNKLSEDEVIQIKKELQNYYIGQVNDLSHFYKVSKATISLIKTGSTWSHISIS